jgi:hypothetical protein
MRAEADPWRVWLTRSCLLSSVLFWGALAGCNDQPPRAAASGGTSEPRVLAPAAAAVLPASTPAYSPLGPHLVGRILSTRDEPVPGARVFIDAAGPRIGRGYT